MKFIPKKQREKMNDPFVERTKKEEGEEIFEQNG